MMEQANWELIVHRLDTIAKNQEVTTDKLNNIEEKLTKFESIKDSVNDLKSWKSSLQQVISTNELKELRYWKLKMDEITSPKLLDETLKDIDKLKTFRTQALMIWVVVQAIMVVLIFLKDILSTVLIFFFLPPF